MEVFVNNLKMKSFFCNFVMLSPLEDRIVTGLWNNKTQKEAAGRP